MSTYEKKGFFRHKDENGDIHILLPDVEPSQIQATADDEGKVLGVKDGAVGWVENEGSGSGGTQGDWSVNDPEAAGYILNRTHYVISEGGEVTLTFDGDITDKEYVKCVYSDTNEFASYYVKISDDVPESTQFIGQTLVLAVNGAENSIVVTEEMVSEEFVELSTTSESNGSGYMYNDLLIVAFEDMTATIGTFNPVVLSSGIWACYIPSDPNVYLKSLTYNTPEEIQQLSQKFIPNADWSVNDPEAAGYIKNRPFYEGDPVESVVLEETSFTSEDMGGMYGSEFQFTGNHVIIKDTAYNIIYDGTTYNIISEEIAGYNVIGNPSIAGMGSDNGYNFLVIIMGDAISIATTDTESTTHSLFISLVSPTVHKIDSKYLPDAVGISTEGRTMYISDAEYVGTKSDEIFNDINNFAAGGYSHAEGRNTYAVGEASHAEGYNTNVYGDYAHAEGNENVANGDASHVEGYENGANGNYSHAEGNRSFAEGEASHAEGRSTSAVGTASHAEGYYTAAYGDYQHVQGKYNILDENNAYAHIVGNGTDFDADHRSNAHTLDWDGNAWFAGDIYLGGTGMDDETAVSLLQTIAALETRIAELESKLNLTNAEGVSF